VNLAQIRSAVPETFHTQTKSHGQRQKQNLAQFTACDNETTLTCSRRLPTKASAEGAVRRGAVTSTHKLTFYFLETYFMYIIVFLGSTRYNAWAYTSPCYDAKLKRHSTKAYFARGAQF